MECLDPEFLLLPDKIVSMIPPRPAGYINSRELFNKRTGLAFDALSPAETAADLPLSFLFNTERASRMEQEGVIGGLPFNEMLTFLVNHIWKASRRTGMEKLIQQQTEQVLLTYMLSLSMNTKTSFQVQADTKRALGDLKAYIESKIKNSQDASYTAHLLLALDRMKKPEDAKPTMHEEIPPGSPIGCDME